MNISLTFFVCQANNRKTKSVQGQFEKYPSIARYYAGMSGISITAPVTTSAEGQLLLQKKVFGFANGFYILHKYD